jgi:CRP/FNR family transcriptional regulator, cyclic AMP receptor protein
VHPLEGKIDIVKINGASKTLIVTLGKGEFFGEMAVTKSRNRTG